MGGRRRAVCHLHADWIICEDQSMLMIQGKFSSIQIIILSLSLSLSPVAVSLSSLVLKKKKEREKTLPNLPMKRI
jgi:hypothetical protein